MGTHELHVMFNAWAGPTPWYGNSLFSPTAVYGGPTWWKEVPLFC